MGRLNYLAEQMPYIKDYRRLISGIHIWGVYDNLPEAMKGLLALGFNVGSQRITVGLVIISAGILYLSFLASWMVQKFPMDKVLAKQGVQTGVRVRYRLGWQVWYSCETSILLRLLSIVLGWDR